MNNFTILGLIIALTGSVIMLLSPLLEPAFFFGVVVWVFGNSMIVWG